MKDTYKVIIADDHEEVRKGLKKIIEKGGDFVVVGQAKDGEEAVLLVNQKLPDLLILDVILPLIPGEEVARRLTSENSPVKILAVSSFDSPQLILGMLENGASGYLTKDEAPFLLRKASKEILLEKSKKWISESLKRQSGMEQQRTVQPVLAITQKEHQVLELLRNGAGVEEIASQMYFTNDRVDRYIHILMMKYHVETVEELVQSH